MVRIEPRARAAAQAGAAFLALHALIHLWDAAAGREHAHQLLDRSADRVSAAGIGDLDRLDAFQPRRNVGKRRRTMMKWFLRRWIAKFERTWNYDARLSARACSMPIRAR